MKVAAVEENVKDRREYERIQRGEKGTQKVQEVEQQYELGQTEEEEKRKEEEEDRTCSRNERGKEGRTLAPGNMTGRQEGNVVPTCAGHAL